MDPRILTDYDEYAERNELGSPKATVVTTQPRRSPFNEWQDDLFACSNDMSSCLGIGFCAPCYLCHMYHRYHECLCVPLMNPCAVITLRSFHRGRERIRGTMLQDCLIGTFCCLCAMCQIDRDMKHYELCTESNSNSQSSGHPEQSHSSDPELAFNRKRKRATVPLPFSFEAKDLEIRIKREQLARDAEQQAIKMANSFRARLMRVGSPDQLPNVPSRPPVKPQPFNFRTETRCVLRQSKCHNSMTGENTALPKPKPASVIYREPFYPIPPSRSPLRPVSPDLATLKRAKKRQLFDEQVEQRRKSMDKRMKRLEEERRKQEEIELIQLRATLVHKAQPIRHYRPIRPSIRKPSTKPQSPKFYTRKRLETIR